MQNRKKVAASKTKKTACGPHFKGPQAVFMHALWKHSLIFGPCVITLRTRPAPPGRRTSGRLRKGEPGRVSTRASIGMRLYVGDICRIRRAYACRPHGNQPGCDAPRGGPRLFAPPIAERAGRTPLRRPVSAGSVNSAQSRPFSSPSPACAERCAALAPRPLPRSRGDSRGRPYSDGSVPAQAAALRSPLLRRLA